MALVDRFLTIADDDAQAYAGFSAAMKLPRDTDEGRPPDGVLRRPPGRRRWSAGLRRGLPGSRRGPRRRWRASNVNAASDLAVASLLAGQRPRGRGQRPDHLPSVAATPSSRAR
jgi:hypothetical protein